MQKFDQKPKKIETVSDVNDEFEYISSSKGKAPEKYSDREEKSSIEKELYETSKEMTTPLDPVISTPQVEEVIKPEIKFEPKITSGSDDLNLDDLGLDDEDDFDLKMENDVAIASQPLPNNPAPQPVASEEVAEEELDSEELEHEEDDLDLDLDLDEDLEEDVVTDAVAQNPQAAPTMEDDLDPKEESKKDDDDIDLDELLKEEESEKQPEPSKPAEVAPLKTAEVAPSKTQSDIDEEDFLKDLDLEEEATIKVPQEEKITTQSSLNNDDDFLDDIDLDEDDLAEAAPKVAPSAPVQEVPAPKISEPMNFETAPQETKNISEPKILRQETVEEASQSIKKLIDAGSMINDMKGFSQNHPIFTEIAMQILEPKLEAWLNEHLPQLVEKIVQEEIKKIMPRG